MPAMAVAVSNAVRMMARPSDLATRPAGRCPGLGWLLLFGGLAGLLYPMSHMLAGLQDGDGVLTSLISTQKLTWYFWGQDRLLNFLPALAAPVTDVQANAHLQIFLRAFMAFLAPVGLLVLIQEDRRSWFITTVLAGFFLALSLSDQYGLFNLYVQHNPFGTSLVLWGISTAILRAWPGAASVLAALAAAFLAYATNAALMMLMLPVLVFLMLFGKGEERRGLFLLLAVQAVALVMAAAHAWVFGERSTSPFIHPSWPAVLAVWKTLSTHLHLGGLGALGAASVVAALLLRTRQAWLVLVLAAAMPVAVTALSALVWVQVNFFNIRYFLVFVLAYCTFCAFLWVTLFARVLNMPAQALVAAGCVAYVFVVKLGGLSSEPGEIVSTTWRGQAKASALVVVEEKANLVAGGFWDVWPVVFLANAHWQRRGSDGLPVYGVAPRGHVLRNKLLGEVSREKGLKVLCLVDSIEECEKVTGDHLIRGAAFHIVQRTVRPVKIGEKTGFLYEVAPIPSTPR